MKKSCNRVMSSAKNRRKRVPRRRAVLRWINPTLNCRIPSSFSRERLQQLSRKLLARCGQLFQTSLRTIAFAGLSLGLGFSAYLVCERIAASGTFELKKLQFRGAKHLSRKDLNEYTRAVAGLIFSADLAQLEAEVQSHPWVKRAFARRKLPDTVIVEVEEYQARAAVVLGDLYLVDREGQVFKRAEPKEAAGLPLISGIERQLFFQQPELARMRVGQALRTLEAYQQRPTRPTLSEVHLGQNGTTTLHLARGGTSLYLGSGLSQKRLGQLDQVWAALGPDRQRATALFLDNDGRPDRVVVRRFQEAAN